MAPLGASFGPWANHNLPMAEPPDTNSEPDFEPSPAELEARQTGYRVSWPNSPASVVPSFEDYRQTVRQSLPNASMLNTPPAQIGPPPPVQGQEWPAVGTSAITFGAASRGQGGIIIAPLNSGCGGVGTGNRGSSSWESGLCMERFPLQSASTCRDAISWLRECLSVPACLRLCLQS